MGRPPVHSPDAILDAARSLVLDAGARGATLDAVIQTSGAPKGSIYHRFASLDELLAEMWVRAVRRSQAAFLEALHEEDPMRAAVAGALSIHDFAAREPGDARLLASLRREDLVEGVHRPDLRRRLDDLNRPLEAAVTELARRLFGRSTHENVERTVCAVIDLPIGAMRRHLVAGSPLPDSLRPQLEAAVRAALAPDERRPHVQRR
jgi:AcrR family transcriptional regulator